MQMFTYPTMLCTIQIKHRTLFNMKLQQKNIIFTNEDTFSFVEIQENRGFCVL